MEIFGIRNQCPSRSIDYDLGQSQDLTMLGSQMVERRSHPDSCFYPERYSLTNDKDLDQYHFLEKE